MSFRTQKIHGACTYVKLLTPSLETLILNNYDHLSLIYISEPTTTKNKIKQTQTTSDKNIKKKNSHTVPQKKHQNKKDKRKTHKKKTMGSFSSNLPASKWRWSTHSSSNAVASPLISRSTEGLSWLDFRNSGRFGGGLGKQHTEDNRYPTFKTEGLERTVVIKNTYGWWSWNYIDVTYIITEDCYL